MYIDEFYFSPFEIKDNVVSIWRGEFIIEKGKISQKGAEITSEEFYDQFVKRAENTWFVSDFITAFSDKKSAIPDSIGEFAIYCQVKSQFFIKIVIR